MHVFGSVKRSVGSSPTTGTNCRNFTSRLCACEAPADTKNGSLLLGRECSHMRCHCFLTLENRSQLRSISRTYEDQIPFNSAQSSRGNVLLHGHPHRPSHQPSNKGRSRSHANRAGQKSGFAPAHAESPNCQSVFGRQRFRRQHANLAACF